MYVVSTCAFPVASWLWQPQPSAWALTVICRATFLLRPIEAVLAPEQEAPVEDDLHHGDDERRSLRAASDLAPLKPRADVTITGHAYAPGGAPVSSLIARLRIGEIDKGIEIFPERYFDQEGVLHHAARFSRMPIVYERAAGGPDSWNPVGVRGVPDSYGRVLLPNLQPPGLAINSPADHIPPIGFGPIAPSWPHRRDRLGRYMRSTPPDGQREPLPEDLDAGYFNHAPRDQQIAGLRDDERIVLENLHPDHPRLVTNLPGVRPRALVEQVRGSQSVALRCDTLWIDTDRSICTLTWRAQVPLESPEEEGRVIISLDAARAPQPSIPEVGRRQLEAAESTVETLPPAGTTTRTTAASRILPFASSGATGGLPFSGSSETTNVGLAPAAPSFGAPPPAPSAPTFGAPPAAPAFHAPPAPVRAPPPPASSPGLGGGGLGSGGLGSGGLGGGGLGAPQRPAFWSVPEAPPPITAPPVMTVGQLAANTDVAPSSPPPSPIAEPPPLAPEPAKAAPAAKQPVEGRRAVQLVWFDPECLPRVRRKSAFRPLLQGIEERSLDADLDDPALARDPAAVEDRRDVFEVVACADAADEAALSEAVERGLRKDGKFVHPFLVVAGEMRLPFDELLTLKATISVASPFAPGDEALRASISDARDLLDVRDLSCPPGVYEGFTTRIQDAFRKMRRAVAPAGYLEEAAERTLLERRAYQRRDVFGGMYLRTLLTVTNGQRPWPLYLPDTSARKLPMFVRFSVRAIVEGWLQEDQFEQHPAALKAFALAKVTPMPSLAQPKPPPAKT